MHVVIYTTSLPLTCLFFAPYMINHTRGSTQCIGTKVVDYGRRYHCSVVQITTFVTGSFQVYYLLVRPAPRPHHGHQSGAQDDGQGFEAHFANWVSRVETGARSAIRRGYHGVLHEVLCGETREDGERQGLKVIILREREMSYLIASLNNIEREVD